MNPAGNLRARAVITGTACRVIPERLIQHGIDACCAIGGRTTESNGVEKLHRAFLGLARSFHRRRSSAASIHRALVRVAISGFIKGQRDDGIDIVQYPHHSGIVGTAKTVGIAVLQCMQCSPQMKRVSRQRYFLTLKSKRNHDLFLGMEIRQRLKS